tara:strand:- start:346 stop:576 length:231 start_codon:yes stop_codon:yes gene_type:complete
MANMSYCRFENTSKDLKDCYNAIRNGEMYEMENYEIEGLRDILELSKQICEMQDSINCAIRDSEKALKEIEDGTYY